MHSSQGLTPQDSLRTHDLALKAQARVKLAKTHIEAGALYIDEYSQLQCEINHAAALRTTYARENAYGLDKSFYNRPRERYGRMAVVAYSGDRLQLPPVPESSGLLAPVENTTNEHAVGASMVQERGIGLPIPDLNAIHRREAGGNSGSNARFRWETLERRSLEGPRED